MSLGCHGNLAPTDGGGMRLINSLTCLLPLPASRSRLSFLPIFFFIVFNSFFRFISYIIRYSVLPFLFFHSSDLFAHLFLCLTARDFALNPSSHISWSPFYLPFHSFIKFYLPLFTILFLLFLFRFSPSPFPYFL